MAIVRVSSRGLSAYIGTKLIQAYMEIRRTFFGANIAKIVIVVAFAIQG
jgi:hypothetical protein